VSGVAQVTVVEGPLERALRRVARPFFSLSELERDLVLYAASGLFALVVSFTSALALYREWGAMAVSGYAFGALASAWLWWFVRHRRVGDRSHLLARCTVAAVVFTSVLAVPLAVEISWRTETPNPYLHVQPEVTVIEHAGQAVANAQDPYRVVKVTGLPARDAAHPLYEQFFPYLPLMAAFGYASSTHAPAPITDARLTFLLVTMVVLAAALTLFRGGDAERFRIGQVLLVLPLGALPLVTGGDDLPVVALLLLGLVLTQRRQLLPAGITFGVAAAMKFTAWPIALLALAFCDASGRRGSRRPMAIGFGAVLIPIVLPYAIMNPVAFLQNVVLYPLGLTGVPSPAQTPFFGHLVVSLLPHLHRVYAVAIAVVGVVLIGRSLRRRPPRTAGSVATFAAWCAVFIVAVAPSTRVGYLLYPLDFALWGSMLTAVDTRSLLSSALEDPNREFGRLDGNP